jgi:hypothetical protein
VNAFERALSSSRGLARIAALGLGTISILLTAGCASEHATSLRPPPLSEHYRDPAGWSLRYPAGMRLERSEFDNLWVSVHEVTVANFTPRRAVRSGSNPHRTWFTVDPPEPKDGPFPADGIAFRFVRREGGPPVPIRDDRESRFPLRLSAFEPDPYAIGRPRPLLKAIYAGGQGYAVYAWTGPDASPRDRGALEAVVASLAFPHLKPGTLAGSGFAVLDRASDYPTGSFTRVRARASVYPTGSSTRVRAQGHPFYLVHAPGGFYGVGWNWYTSGGYKSMCAMRFDGARKQFFCTDKGLRWDRIGRPLVFPAYGMPDPLTLAPAKVSWDGHVLLAAEASQPGDDRDKKRFWPRWSSPHL